MTTEADFTHYEGDYFGPIEAELFEENGDPVNLDQVDAVWFELHRLGGKTAVLNVEAEVTPAEGEEPGSVKVELDPEEAAAVVKGTYRFVWRVEKSGDVVKHYPTERNAWFTLVCDKAGTVPEVEEP